MRKLSPVVAATAASQDVRQPAVGRAAVASVLLLLWLLSVLLLLLRLLSFLSVLLLLWLLSLWTPSQNLESASVASLSAAL